MKQQTVHQVSFFPRFFPVNCYLIEEEAGLTLIDAAMPFSTKKILQVAAAIGKPITRIVLTHAHGDHVGALDELKALHPDAPVYISDRDARLLAGDRSLDAAENDFPIRGGVPKHVKTKPDLLIKDGDQIGSLLAIATPGHTPGSMSFLDTRNEALIVGDAMQTKGGIAVSGQMKLTFPFPALATWNKYEAVKSVRRLLEFKPSQLAVGHGKMIDSPIKSMETAIEKAETKLA
ncbi:MBL fold metallo-hydrolase [Radiobacillus sp. PE A8.2]|uniref:MBL fold metallo-hydrolase n=1 Tax=Radiobacillus sp. PE A8.2 TaxID=3380349 RepID=UPI00388F0E0A